MKNYDPDEGVINLRDDDSNDDDAEFRINPIDDEEEEIPKKPDPHLQTLKSSDKVKVKFDKFVTLIATRDSDEIFDKHMNDDVIISADLLTDLASSTEQKEGSKTPFIFLVGILLGIAVAWILLKT